MLTVDSMNGWIIDLKDMNGFSATLFYIFIFKLTNCKELSGWENGSEHSLGYSFQQIICCSQLFRPILQIQFKKNVDL